MSKLLNKDDLSIKITFRSLHTSAHLIDPFMYSRAREKMLVNIIFRTSLNSVSVDSGEFFRGSENNETLIR